MTLIQFLVIEEWFYVTEIYLGLMRVHNEGFVLLEPFRAVWKPCGTVLGPFWDRLGPCRNRVETVWNGWELPPEK